LKDRTLYQHLPLRLCSHSFLRNTKFIMSEGGTFKVLPAALIQNQVLPDVKPCRLVNTY